jgi:hypothetical protein
VAAVLGAVLAFVALQAALAVALEAWRPEVRDPEYGAKLRRLQALRAAHPDAPLVLALGSSRSLMGLRPADLPGAGEPGRPLVFNFGLTGYGPVQELVCYRRLRAEGVRPAAVLVELTPFMLTVDRTADNRALEPNWSFADLAVLGRYRKEPAELYRAWGKARAVPWFSYRYSLLNWLLPASVPYEAREGFKWVNVDEHGWWLGHEQRDGPVPPEEFRRRVESARAQFDAARDWRVTPAADGALRELLGACRADGAAAAVYLMPESSAMRSWYGPAGRERLAAYLERLGLEEAVPVIDGRAWVPDSGFEDAHHLGAAGSRLCTERFGHEVVGPLLRGAGF